MSVPVTRRPVPAPRTLSEEELAAGPWARRAGPFRALGHAFEVHCADDAVAGYLESVLAPLAAAGPADTVYSLRAVGDGADSGFALYQGCGLLVASTDPVYVVDHLLWSINGAAVRATPERLLIHAAAAGDGTSAALIPAPSGSGKTTLVAALVHRGAHYLTDETVAIDLDTQLVHPYPRSLSVKHGSWAALAPLVSTPTPDLPGFGASQWQIDPRHLGPGHLSGPAPAALVIAPRYVAGATSRLEAMSRADAVMLMARSCFNLAAHGGKGLAVLADIARRSSCYRLVMGDLAAAADLVERVLLRAGGSGVR